MSPRLGAKRSLTSVIVREELFGATTISSLSLSVGRRQKPLPPLDLGSFCRFSISRGVAPSSTIDQWCRLRQGGEDDCFDSVGFRSSPFSPLQTARGWPSVGQGVGQDFNLNAMVSEHLSRETGVQPAGTLCSYFFSCF